MVKVSALVATSVSTEGYQEILGVQVATGETTASWRGFSRDLVASGLKPAGQVRAIYA